MHRWLIAFSFCGLSILQARASSFADEAVEAKSQTPVQAQAPTVDQLPLLLDALKNETRCFPKKSDTVDAIVQLRGRATPTIVARIKFDNGKTWKAPVRHVYLLALIGPEARAALPALEQLVESPKASRYTVHYVATAKAAIHEDIEQLGRLAAKDIGFVALQVIEHLGERAGEAGPQIAALARKNTSRRQKYLQTGNLAQACNESQSRDRCRTKWNFAVVSTRWKPQGVPIALSGLVSQTGARNPERLRPSGDRA